MRVYLDTTIARWLRQAFDRPFSFEEAGDQDQWALVSIRLRDDSHGAFIELSDFEPDLAGWFIRQLILKSVGKTYNRAFRRIAVEVAEKLGASVIDRLADLLPELRPAPKPVKLGRRDPRDRAIDKIVKRKKV